MTEGYLRFVVSMLLVVLSAPVLAWKMEAGSINLPATTSAATFTTFPLQQIYNEPPIIFIVGTEEGPNAAEVRIQNVGVGSFEAAIVEPLSEDGPHAAMDVHYLAVERGASGTQWDYVLPDGSRIVVGELSTDEQSFNNTVGNGQDRDDTDRVNLPSPSFSSSQPTVLAQIQTMNNSPGHRPDDELVPWLSTVVTDVEDDRFEVSIERSEDWDRMRGPNFSVDGINNETIGYMVLESSTQGVIPNVGGGSVTFETINTATNAFQGFLDSCRTQSFAATYTDPPLVMATKVTRNSEDGGWLRRCSLNNSSVGFQVDEETRQDTDRSTAGEGASLLVVSGNFVFDSEYEPTPESTDFLIEAGSVILSDKDDWQTVEFNQSYPSTPAVFVLTDTNNPDPQAFRIRNVDEDSFQIQAIEPPRASGVGFPEPDMEAHYVVFPVGEFEFPFGGPKFEVDIVSMNNYQSKYYSASSSYLNIIFEETGFTSAPSVLVQVQSDQNSYLLGDDPWLTGFARNPSRLGVQLSMDRGEVRDGRLVLRREDVAYLAIEKGIFPDFKDLNGQVIKGEAGTTGNRITGDCVSHTLQQGYGQPPLVVANKQSLDGGDGGWTRRCSVSSTEVLFEIDEDVASDNDRSHTTEDVAYVAFSDSFVADFSNQAYYQLDETSWTDSINEAADSSNNNLHGTPTGAADTSPAQVCYGADLDGSGQFVNVPDNDDLDIEEELTVTAWVNPSSYGSGSDLRTIVSKDENYEFHITSSGSINWWWEVQSGGSDQITTGIFSADKAPLNQWTHIAIVYSSEGKYRRIFVNGDLREEDSSLLSLPALRTNTDPLQIGGDQGRSDRYFHGLIDEVRVYSRAISEEGIQDIMRYTHPCESRLDHIEISATDEGSTCNSHSVTLTACADDSEPCTKLLADYTETVTLRVIDNSGNPISRGSWNDGSAKGTLTDNTADDGLATYEFVTNDAGQAIVTLDYFYADEIKLQMEDSFNGFIAESNAIEFKDNAFVIRWTDNLDANPTDNLPTYAVAGRPHEATITHIRRDRDAVDPNAQCGVVTDYDGDRDLLVWYSDSGLYQITPAAPVLAQGGSSLTLPASKPGSANYFGLSFSSGVANVAVETTDVGQFTMSASDLSGYVSELNGDPVEVTGSSATATVSPFGLTLDVHDEAATVTCSTQGERASDATGDSYATGPTGSVYKKAGESFKLAARAVLWDTNDDSNNDGDPDDVTQLFDNTCAPSFGQENTSESVTLSVSSFLPAGGEKGVLLGENAGNFVLDSFVSGVASSQTNYNEVGIVSLSGGLTSASYLGSGRNLSVALADFGRFIPAYFGVTHAPTELTLQSPMFDSGNPADSCEFTYLGQDFGLSDDIELTITAYAEDDSVTQNYGGDYWKVSVPDTSDETVSDAVSVSPEATLEISDTSTITLSENTDYDGDGIIEFSGLSMVYQRGTALDPPFDGLVDWALGKDGLTDDDDVCHKAAASDTDCLDYAIDDVGSESPRMELRYGRVTVGNNSGSELLDLELPVRIEHWMETAASSAQYTFDLSSDDVCSSDGWITSDVTLSGFIGDLTGTDTSAVLSGFSAGSESRGIITLSAPSGQQTGSANATLDVQDWLKFDFYNRGDENPTGTGTFGVYSGRQPIFYLRESYR